MKLVVSGIQPTGLIHIGNYLGALKTWKTLQESSDSLFLIVDNHAITTSFFKSEPADQVCKDLRTSTILTAATLKSIGIKNVFIQSHVKEILSFMWVFNCISPMSWFQKMTQYKEKKSNAQGTSLGIFSYPSLMAADILTFKATHVPVGEDQTQHLELTKDITQRFNKLFGDYFPLPEPVFSKVPKIMDLRDSSLKMSKSQKSDFSRINLLDSPELVYKKVIKAKTDSVSEVYFDENRPELANLLRIYSELNGISPEEAGRRKWNNVLEFKEGLIESLVKELNPIREKALQLENSDELRAMLKESSEIAREKAAKNLENVNKLIGLV